MSEANEMLEGMICHASGVIAAAKGKIKIREAMRLVGFANVQVETMSLYQRVRQKSMQMVVVDKRATPKADCPVPQVNVGSGDTVTSTLSSSERTNVRTQDSNSTEDDANDPVVPRRLLGMPPEARRQQKKKCRGEFNQHGLFQEI